MNVSVIISTYNQPQWLELALCGWQQQTIHPFEIIVADDGSDHRTSEVIARFKHSFDTLNHVWHPDNGFQKTTILNRAIVTSRGEYLVFTDGDCIPRRDFLDAHLRQSRPKRFLSGGYHKLSRQTSDAITLRSIEQQDCFETSWLRNHGMRASVRDLKLLAKGSWSALLDSITTTRPTFNGHNASAWRSDLVATNGFDNRMKYGGEDRELGERLEMLGVRGYGIRYRAICLHLDHARGYVNEMELAINDEIRRTTREQHITKTINGITELR